MISIIKNLSKTAVVILAASLAFTSCTKDNNAVSPLTAKNTQAAVPSASTVVVNGNYGNPASGPAAFGTKYVDIVTGAQDSVGLVANNLLFTSTNNGNISAEAGYTFKYLITTKALSAVTTADYTSATTVTTSFGRNTSTTATPNGWWNYSTTTRAASPVSNIVLLVSDGTNNYAFKCTAIAGQGSATNNRAVYTFSVGQII